MKCSDCGRYKTKECYANPTATDWDMAENFSCFISKEESDWSKGEPVALAMENTSGQGRSAVIPKEIRGWNWGAFFFGWLWGICNRVWISLLSAIPYVGVIMLIVLGVKGNEWAWRNKRWDSIEHFKRTQRTWAYWALAIFLLSVLLILFISIVEGC